MGDKVISLIKRIRRKAHKKDCAEFLNILINNQDELIAELNTRWLVSICDTIADHHPDDLHRSNAMILVTFINSIKLMNAFEIGRIHKYDTQLELWDGVFSYNVSEGDLPRNMFKRINSIMRKTPLIHKIWKEIIKRLANSNNKISELAAKNKKFWGVCAKY